MKRVLIGMAFAVMPMLQSEAKPGDTAAIEQVETQLCKAQLALDVDAIMKLYVPGESFQAFDMVKPRQYVGAAAWRSNWSGFLQAFVAKLDSCTIEQLVVERSGPLAATHYVMPVTFTDKNGKTISVVTRITHILKNIGGKWLIVHEHGSYPIDWQTGVADTMSHE